MSPTKNTMKITGRLSTAFLMVLLLALPLLVRGDPPAATRPTLTVHHAATTPAIIADPADPAWPAAAVIDGLSLCLGPQGAGLKPTDTQVRVMWDADFLYVRFICQEQSIYTPHGTQRDAMHSQGDVAEVFIDAVGDCRQFIELQVNPLGGTMDGRHTITTQPVSGPDGVLAGEVLKKYATFDLAGDMKGLRTAAAITDADHGGPGWIADLAIPAPPLLERAGLQKFHPMALRINFIRYDQPDPKVQPPAKKPVFMNWSPVVWGRPHRSPAAMGTLVLEP